MFIGSPDVLHDYAYVPDIARAAETLLDAPDSSFGQAWHVPMRADPHTRHILKIAADTLGVKLRISAMPAWMLGASVHVLAVPARAHRNALAEWDRSVTM